MFSWKAQCFEPRETKDVFKKRSTVSDNTMPPQRVKGSQVLGWMVREAADEPRKGQAVKRSCKRDDTVGMGVGPLPM